MLSPESLPYLFAFCFQFFLLTAYHLALQLKVVQQKVVNKKFFWWVLAVIIFSQVFSSALLKKEVGDVMLFAGAGWHLRHQIDFYFIDANHTQYPFFPFLIFLHAGLNWLQEVVPLFTFSFYLKLVLIVAAVALSVLIKKEQKNANEGMVAQLQFLTHPLLTLAVLFHGQVEVILLAFFLWSVYWLEQSKVRKNFFTGVVAYALSVAAKTWSIIFLPWMVLSLKKWWQRVTLVFSLGVILIGITFVYTRAVDGSSVRTVLPAVLRPGGPVGEWGVSLVLRPWVAALQKINLLIFAAGMAVIYALLLWKKPASWLAYLILTLGVYLIIPNFGVQYLFWVVPFLYLSRIHRTREINVYSGLGGLYAFLCYWNIAAGGESIPFALGRAVGFVLWLFCGWWVWQLLKKATQKYI
jgi:hypothetical protein